MRFTVTAAGHVTGFKVLTEILRHSVGDATIERSVVTRVRTFLSRYRFKRQKGVSHITLPLIFEREG